MIIKKTVFSPSVIVLLSFFSGCTFQSKKTEDSASFHCDWINQEKIIESVQNYVVKKDVAISITNVNGSITLKGHPHNNVTVTVTKQGNKDEFSKIKAHINALQESIVIETESEPHKNLALHYELLVPESAHLELIKTVNGSIIIENISGPITAKTVNGPITVDKITQNATITSINGSIECAIVKDSNALLKAKALLGSIETDFDIPKTTTVTGQSIKGIIGNSEQAIIKIKTSTGSIKIKKV